LWWRKHHDSRGADLEKEAMANRQSSEQAKNVAVAKDFLKYLIQPPVLNEWLKTGLGRNTPNMPSIVKNDPWWFADPHRAAYTKQALLEQTVPPYWAFNPGYAQIQTEHVWSQGWMDVIQGGMTPEAANLWCHVGHRQKRQVVVRMGIDEAGRDDHATGIHLSRALCA
jgi:hypothetical protein